MPNLLGNEHLCIHFLAHRPRFVHFSTENVRSYFVKIGHQNASSRADAIGISENKRSKVFP